MTAVDHDISTNIEAAKIQILRSWNSKEKLIWPSFKEDPVTHQAFKKAWLIVREELSKKLGEDRLLDIVDFGHATGLSLIYKRTG